MQINATSKITEVTKKGLFLKQLTIKYFVVGILNILYYLISIRKHNNPKL